ncbi:MAG TPA: methyl-accepting chemotaxis protein [Bryobacteraceae bacterium]|nr:methyl-accepting chemotaxis protein [Bryobacteraceae bacterium]
MQWFRDRKTVTKLMIGFGIMALFMGVLGYESIRNITSLNTSMRDMYEHNVLGLNYLKDANLQLTAAGKSMRNAAMAKDAKDMEFRVGELRANRDMFVKDIEAFQKCLVVEAMKAKTLELMDEFRLNARAQDKVVEILESGHREEGIAQIAGLNSLEKRRTELMVELTRNELDTMKKAAADVDETASAAKTSSMILMLAAVVVALVLGFGIARMITTALGLMVEEAGRLAAGDLDRDFDYKSKSEIGKLGAALTDVVTTLKGLIGETSQLVSAARAGNLERRGNDGKFSGAFRDLIVGINETVDAFAAPVKEASAVLAKVAARDLSARMEGDYQGDFATIKNSLNTAVTNLGDALGEVKTSADNVATTAQALSAASGEISSGAQEQASSLEETASSLEEMTATVKQNAENARQASQLASASRDGAEKGGQVVKAAVGAMTEINQSSTRIADIITTIDEIAFQTNLLALNAAVEAARAGEQGRGFAVVAAEVRNLAQRSATAAKEIKALIQDSLRKVENGSELVNRSGQTLEEIVQSVKRVTDIVTEIAAASHEQSTGIEQVNKATMQMDQVTQANASQTEEMSSTAQGLSANAEQLQSLVASFHLGAQDLHASTTAAQRPVPAARPVKKKASPLRAAGMESTLASLARHTTGQVKADVEEF